MKLKSSKKNKTSFNFMGMVLLLPFPTNKEEK
jgi:hypothetical protein